MIAPPRFALSLDCLFVYRISVVPIQIFNSIAPNLNALVLIVEKAESITERMLKTRKEKSHLSRHIIIAVAHNCFCCTCVVTYACVLEDRRYLCLLSVQEKFSGIAEFAAPALLLLLSIYAGTFHAGIIARDYYYYHGVVETTIFILFSFLFATSLEIYK